MSAFVKSIQNTAHANALWTKGSKILVGVSGGPDSMCLLEVLASLKEKYEWKLRIAHINYGLRGQDSEDDEALVKASAKRLNIPFSILRVAVVKQTNLEEHLRDIRYRFFEKTRRKHDFDTVAVAHTIDDQAETVLMRLIRGSGLSGLRAMQPKNGAVIRPLLRTQRSDILTYLETNKIPYRIDSSNADKRFFRNKIRHQLIPYLQEHFNPNIKDVLARTAQTLSEDYESLLSCKDAFPLNFRHESSTLAFDIPDFLALPTNTQAMTLIHLLSVIRDGNVKNISHSNVKEALKMLRSTKSKHKTLDFSGLNISCRGDVATISILRS